MLKLDWKVIISGGALTVASPSIDARRLADIYLLLIRNKGRPFSIQLYTQLKPQKFKEAVDDAKTILAKIKDEEIKKRSLLNKQDIEWAVNKIPTTFHSFHCNFIAAAIAEDKNEILVTSARFTRTHFDLGACDTVSHAKMTDKGLREFYLLPLGIRTRAASETSLVRNSDSGGIPASASEVSNGGNFARSNTLPRNYQSRSMESLDRRSDRSTSRSDKSITRPDPSNRRDGTL